MTISFFPLMVAAVYGLLIVLLLNLRQERGPLETWLQVLFGIMIADHLLAAALGSQPDTAWLQHLTSYTWAASLIPLTFLSLAFGEWRRFSERKRPAILVLSGWIPAVFIIDLLVGHRVVVAPVIGELYAFPRFDIGGLLLLATWFVLALGLVLGTVLAAARARLPLHANRLIFWAGVLVLVFLGQLLFALRNPIVSAGGATIQLLGTGGLLYAVLSYQLFDIRGAVRQAAGYLLPASLTLSVLVVAVLAAQGAPPNAIGGLLAFALLLAVIHQVAHLWFGRFINRFVINREYDPAVIVETYARAIGHILDVETLATVAIGIISEVLEIQRGAIMLISRDRNRAIARPAGGMARILRKPMVFPIDGSFFSHFVNTGRPLLQYSIDVLPEHQDLTQEQRQWLNDLQMDVYVPILGEEFPIGLLALGTKGSGEPYRADELQLVQTLAGQTVVALNNARLFDEMKQLNTEIRSLNESLRRSNERLQHMDKVKTDFITIASHELRTPLTQIKGYVDILDAMNEEAILTTEEADRLLGNIAKAAGQLEKVITAMLDTSQLDVDVLSLNLSEVNLDLILRTAIHPLAEAMRSRKVRLRISGIADLPTITADFQRLVQVVSNLVSNALKYTSDGGRITITGQALKDDLGVDRQVELVFADTGVGVDPRDQELIFEKFFRAADTQLHSTGSTKFMGAGPGLGLSIVRGIVKAHAGRIWVESEGYDPIRCPGSAFHVVLPIKTPQPEPELTEPLSLEDLTTL
jgi:signal transduction histidine kinase